MATPTYGYGTDKQYGKAVGYTDKNAEIQRTLSVIQNRQNSGMDTSAQLNHYKNLTGKDYTPPTVSKPVNAPSGGSQLTKVDPPMSISPVQPQSVQSQSYNPALGYGTAQQYGQNVGYSDKDSEINRTLDVIRNRLNSGLDTSAQTNWYNQLTGQQFSTDLLNQNAPNNNQLQQQMQAQNEYLQSMFGNLTNALQQQQQPQMNQEYQTVLQQLMSQYEQLAQQLEYYKMMQQYYGMYGNNRNAASPFI